MPQPTRGEVHVNRPLTNISIAYMQDQEDFIADQVFPSIPVQKRSDNYISYPKEYWFRSEAEKRAPSTESAGSGWEVDNTNSYICDPYSIHKDIDDQIRSNADAPIDMDRDATAWVTQQLMLKREKEWANDYFDTGIWTTEYQGVASSPTTGEVLQWDQADSTPIEDITNARINIAELTGFKPNVLVLSPYVYNVLKNNADVLDRIKYTQAGMVTTDIMAGLFDVDRVLVAWGVENTAAEGATASYDFVYGKHALLAYSNPRPSLLTPSAGYTFNWTGMLGAGEEGTRIKTFRMEHLNSDRVEGDMAFDTKLVAPDLGVFFYQVVS